MEMREREIGKKKKLTKIDRVQFDIYTNEYKHGSSEWEGEREKTSEGKSKISFGYRSARLDGDA